MGNRNKYRNYSSQDLENAIKLVNSQTLSIRGASRRYECHNFRHVFRGTIDFARVTLHIQQ